jgi:peptidoglycan/LPS O-acetylase OafA/YrhL
MSSSDPSWLAHRPMGHIAALDGLRGIAIVLVFGVHYYAPIFSGGSSGVDLFFVLSGFLITKLMLDEHQRRRGISRSDFYLRRAFRILPALLVLMVGCLILSFTILADVGWVLRREVLLSTFSMGNLWPLFYGFTPRTALGHTWSLAIEEQFYLVWPLILGAVLVAGVRWQRFAKGIILVTIASILIGRVVVFGLLHYPHWESIPFFNFDGLAIGCLIAVFLHNDDAGVSNRLPRWPAVLAVGFVVFDFFFARVYISHDTYDIRTLLLRVAFGYILLIIVCTPDLGINKRLTHPVLVTLGLWSYSLYLWHLPALYVFSSDRYPGAPRILLAVLRLVVPFVLALLSFYLVERPALRLGRRVRNRRAARAPQPALDDVQPGTVTWQA